MTEAITRSVEEMPALDLSVDRFVLHGREFGKLEVKAHTSHDDNQPVWTLDSLIIEQPGAKLTGNGSWRLPRRLREAAAQGDASSTEGRRTLLNFKLDIRNGGDVLERMGLPHTLRDGKGTFEGRIAWRGSPMSIDYPTLSGRLKLNIENGQILSVDPGARAAARRAEPAKPAALRHARLPLARAGGWCSTASTAPARSKTAWARSKSSSSRVARPWPSMSGTADLLHETQDLEVAVTPRINATTTSVAAAFINPVLGIGTLAAQLMFADEISKVFTQHYRVSGSWADPKVTKVEDNKTQPPIQERSGAYPR
jgi:uncharacterized protein YhdP